jgi:hypothetical protein
VSPRFRVPADTFDPSPRATKVGAGHCLEAQGFHLPFCTLALAQDEESGGTSGQARSGGGSGQRPVAMKKHRINTHPAPRIYRKIARIESGVRHKTFGSRDLIMEGETGDAKCLTPSTSAPPVAGLFNSRRQRDDGLAGGATRTHRSPGHVHYRANRTLSRHRRMTESHPQAVILSIHSTCLWESLTARRKRGIIPPLHGVAARGAGAATGQPRCRVHECRSPGESASLVAFRRRPLMAADARCAHHLDCRRQCAPNP